MTCNAFQSKTGHRGVSLIELMIAMMILAIVCVAWLEIIGIQSARREARRREAVERITGMMDAFAYCRKSDLVKNIAIGYYYPTVIGDEITFDKTTEKAREMFDSGISSILYRLEVESTPQGNLNWGSCRWLTGLLYDDDHHLSEGKSFFRLRICLGTVSQ